MARSVLVVDDDPVFLALAIRVLREMGFAEVTTTATAAAAVRAALAGEPDAALVDVGLPDRDGADLAQELAALPWSPRVVLTSSDPDVATMLTAPPGRPVPFVAKEELAGDGLRRLLIGDG